MMRQHDVRRLMRGAPVFRITSEDLDDVEAQLFDEIQAEIDAGFPAELNPEPRRTVANTRSSSPFYRLPRDDSPLYRRPHRPAPKVWPLIPQMPPTSKSGPEVCWACNCVHRGPCW